MTQEVWLRTDEALDVVGSLKQCIRSFSDILTDEHAWKWLCLALHSAVQGACVCHLTTTASPVGCLTDDNTKEWLAFFEASRTDKTIAPPRTNVAPLPELLRRVRKPFSAGDRSNAIVIAISSVELNWLDRFHREIRNQFAHFGPMGWSIELSGVPEISALVCRIIRDIAEVGWGFRHLDTEARTQLLAGLTELEEAARDHRLFAKIEMAKTDARSVVPQAKVFEDLRQHHEARGVRDP